jgi:hypothetical protein
MRFCKRIKWAAASMLTLVAAPAAAQKKPNVIVILVTTWAGGPRGLRRRYDARRAYAQSRPHRGRRCSLYHVDSAVISFDLDI